MSQDPIEYLSTRVLIDKIPVTYRTLSRKAQIHVNEAKRYLYKFHSSHENVHCTYLISGHRVEQQDDDAVHPLPLRQTFMLVKQGDLDKAKLEFDNVLSIHVYSVEPTDLSNLSVLSGINGDNANYYDLVQTVGYNSDTYGIILNESIPDPAQVYCGKAKVNRKEPEPKQEPEPEPEPEDTVVEGDIEMQDQDQDQDQEKLKDIFKDDDLAQLEDSHHQESVSDSDEAAQVLPPAPAPAPPPGKRLVKVTKTITTQNEKGYLVSKTQDVWQEVSDNEQQQQQPPPSTNNKNPPVKTVKKQQQQKQQRKPTPAGGQSSLMNFLKKKK